MKTSNLWRKAVETAPVEPPAGRLPSGCADGRRPRRACPERSEGWTPGDKPTRGDFNRGNKLHIAYTLRRISILLTTFPLLLFLWAMLCQAGPVSPAPGEPPDLPLAPTSPVTGAPSPDLRWLTIVRASPSRRVAAQQTTLPTIHIHLIDGIVAGRVALAAMVAISVTRDSRQVAHATATPLPEETGFFYIAYLTRSSSVYATGGGGYYHNLQAGDVVWVAQAGIVASMTVPALTGLATADADTVYGTATISQPVTIYLFPFDAPEISYTRTVTANGTGHYQANWSPALDLRPRDSGYVAYTEAADRRAYARFITPFLRVQVSGKEIYGFAAPHSQVTITITHPGGQVQDGMIAHASSDGIFRAWRHDVDLQPADRVIASAAGQTFSMTVSNVAAHADLPNGQVWGEAPAGWPVEVLRFKGPLQSEYDSPWDQLPIGQATVTTTINGYFTASLPLARADYGAALVTSPDGHQSYARCAVPYLWTRMGEAEPNHCSPAYLLQGQVDDVAAPITVAIQGPSGYLKDLHYLTAASNGYFREYTRYYQNMILDSGDIITLTTPRGVQVTLTLPVLTAQANAITDTVSGLAPPGAVLTVTIYTTYYGASSIGSGTLGGGYCNKYTRVVTATAQGEYRADLSGIVDFTSQASGEVQLATPEGHPVVRTFRVLQCQPHLDHVQVGGNALSVLLDYSCPAPTLRLRDAQGRLKAERQLYSSYIYLYDGDRPIPILPGDMIEIESEDRSSTPIPTPTPWPKTQTLSTRRLFTMTVPSLTVTLDPATNTITGQAPPGAVLYLRVYNEWTRDELTATVSAQGTYSVNLAGRHTLAPGDRVQVTYSANEWPDFQALGVLARLQATLYQAEIQGLLPPLTPYTVSLESPRITDTIAGHYASTDGMFYIFWLIPTMLMPDDTIVVTTPDQVLRLRLPSLSARLDRAAAQVYGHAPPHARLRVNIYSHSQVVTATAAGVYTASVPGLSPAQATWGTLIYFSDEGHQARLDFASAQWQVTLDRSCVNGLADIAGVPITVTLTAEDGTPKGTIASRSQAWSGGFSVCFQKSIQSGDRLTLTHPTGVMTFTVPALTAHHDYARQALEGQALPFSAIAITFRVGGWGAWPTRHVLADAGGRYGVDTSDLRLVPGHSGYAMMMDKAGNTIQREFVIQGYPVYLPLVLRSSKGW